MFPIPGATCSFPSSTINTALHILSDYLICKTILLTMGEMHRGTIANIEIYVSVYFATIDYIFSNTL